MPFDTRFCFCLFCFFGFPLEGNISSFTAHEVRFNFFTAEEGRYRPQRPYSTILRFSSTLGSLISGRIRPIPTSFGPAESVFSFSSQRFQSTTSGKRYRQLSPHSSSTVDVTASALSPSSSPHRPAHLLEYPFDGSNHCLSHRLYRDCLADYTRKQSAASSTKNIRKTTAATDAEPSPFNDYATASYGTFAQPAAAARYWRLLYNYRRIPLGLSPSVPSRSPPALLRQQQ